MGFEDPTDTIFFASSIFYSIALQKAAQSLHADTQQLGYGCFYREQEKKKLIVRSSVAIQQQISKGGYTEL